MVDGGWWGVASHRQCLDRKGGPSRPAFFCCTGLTQDMQLRARLKQLPELDEARLWNVQARAIRGLEASFAKPDSRALIQMATGSGKTFRPSTSPIAS